MKPRDLFRARIEQDLNEPIAALGFRYSPSRIGFSRKMGIAVHDISFQFDRYNSEDHCHFRVRLLARSPIYSKWHFEQFGKRPPNDIIGAGGRGLPGWSNSDDRWWDGCFCNVPRNDDVVVERIRQNVVAVGIPFLDSISTWKAAAAFQFAEPHFSKTADLHLLDGNLDFAREVILEGIRRYTGSELPNRWRELPDLHHRLAKFFPGVEVPAAASPPQAHPSKPIEEDADKSVGSLFTAAIQASGGNKVVFDPQSLVPELIAYGEPEAALRLVQLSSKDLLEIGRLAYTKFRVGPNEPDMMVDKAICLAVVEFIEGRSRELKRKRRFYQK